MLKASTQTEGESDLSKRSVFIGLPDGFMDEDPDSWNNKDDYKNRLLVDCDQRPRRLRTNKRCDTIRTNSRWRTVAVCSTSNRAESVILSRCEEVYAVGESWNHELTFISQLLELELIFVICNHLKVSSTVSCVNRICSSNKYTWTMLRRCYM